MLCILVMVFCLIAVLLVLLDFYVKNHTTYKIAKSMQSPSMLPIIGSTQFLFQSPEKLFQLRQKLCETYKNGHAYWSFGIFIYNIYSADSVQKILSNPKHFDKSYFYKFLNHTVGTGLLTSSTSKWMARRKLLNPAFHYNILRSFQSNFHHQTDILLDDIKKNEVNKPEGTHLQKLIARLTLNNICESAMGVEVKTIDELDDYRRKLYKIGILRVARMSVPWFVNDFLYFMFGAGKLEKKIANQAQSFTENVISAKRKKFISNQRCQNSNQSQLDFDDEIGFNKKQRLALLDTLLEAEKSQLIDSSGIQEEVNTFIIGGFATTMTTITFALFSIANHKNVQERLYEEIAAMKDDQNYNNLTYLEAVVKESLRMFPSGPLIGRVLGEDTVIDGVKLPAGTTVHINILALHRDPKYFPEPHKFNPDRFLDSTIQHPYAYIPFGGGPRDCIGKKFGMMEVKQAIGQIVKNFELKPITKLEDIVIVPDFLYTARDPVRIQFVSRC